jgi:hypothetical protein
MSEETTAGGRAGKAASRIDCRVVLVIAEQEVLENEPRNVAVAYNRDPILDCYSPKYVLQDSIELSDWIVVTLVNNTKHLTDEQKQRLRGRIEYHIYSNAAAAWMTVPWRLAAILGKLHLNVEFGFYATEI